MQICNSLKEKKTIQQNHKINKIFKNLELKEFWVQKYIKNEFLDVNKLTVISYQQLTF